METIEIIVNKDNSEISVQKYEREYLKTKLCSTKAGNKIRINK